MRDDAITPEVVTPLLRERLGAGLECVAVDGGVLGNGQETWLVDARAADGSERRFVIRRSARAGTQEDTDRSLEFSLLEQLGRRGFPVPAVHWIETERPALGRPYFVMDRVPGRPPGRATAEERAAVAREIGGWLARLHALPVADAPPQLARRADAAEATRAELARWWRSYRATRPAPVPLVGALLGWLEAEVPVGRTDVRILWGDPGPHNVLVDGGRVTGLLDWEQAHLGDPLDDLGVAVWSCLDTYDPEELVAGYEAEAGPVDRDALRYYTILATVVRAVMVLAGVSAFLDRRPTPSLAGLGQYLLVDGLRQAARAAGWAEPETGGSAAGLRPDAAESAAGVARFLREEVVPALADRRLAAQTKTAAALLDTAAARTRDETPDDGAAEQREERAARAERERAPEREELRARLLADLAAQRTLIAPLEALYRRQR